VRHAPVIAASVALGRALRFEGIASDVERELLFCRAVGVLDARRRDDVYWAARATFLASPDEVAAFDAVFERFWAGRPLERQDSMAEHAETDPRMPGAQQGGESLPQFRPGGRSSPLLDGVPSRATQEIPSAGSEDDAAGDRERPRGILAAYSPAESPAPEDRLAYGRDELAAVRRLAEALGTAMPERRSRRLHASRHGRVDLRGTVRASLTTDGEALRLARRASIRAPRRLVLLCDVSGSMERNSRALLAALGGVVGSRVQAEAFVFATRLTRLTGPLTGHDAAAALERAHAQVEDWSGGTRIGAALTEFNRTYARRGLARGAVVLIVSDGWDRGDPVMLATELARLRRQAYRLVWLNPRPTELNGQPLAVGMRAALPHVDDYVGGRDPRALAALAEVCAGLGRGRPSRAQRPLTGRVGSSV